MRLLALSIALNLIAFGAYAADPAYEAAVKRFMQLTDKGAIAALKDQERGANERIRKLIYEIEASKLQGVDAKKALTEALKRNDYTGFEHKLTLNNVYGNWHSLKTFVPDALSPENMARMKDGKAPTTEVRGIKQTLEVDHIVPVKVAPELGTKLHNLRLLAQTVNGSIQDRVPAAAMIRAQDLKAAGMMSDSSYKNLQLSSRTQKPASVPAPSQQAQSTRGGYSTPSYDNAQRQKEKYGSVPGGVLLEGQIGGLPPITTAKFIPASNELLLNGKIRYELPTSRAQAADIFAALAKDDRIGVSLPVVFSAGLNEVYGALATNSMVARGLTLTDAFLGAIVFRDHHGWLDNYQFAEGHARDEDLKISLSVNFTIHGFEGEIRQNRLLVPRSQFTVTFVPLSDETGPNGESLPMQSPEKVMSAKLTAVGQHVADNIGYYRREPIVEQAFRYGEVAALARELSRGGANLREIASSMR